jgi:hypothetical protein
MGEAELLDVPREILSEEEAPRCDVCGEPVVSADDDDEGVAPTGRGVYLWSRGGERVYEQVPLCGSCSTAIGVSALMRWEIEEEEG